MNSVFKENCIADIRLRKSGWLGTKEYWSLVKDLMKKENVGIQLSRQIVEQIKLYLLDKEAGEYVCKCTGKMAKHYMQVLNWKI